MIRPVGDLAPGAVIRQRTRGCRGGGGGKKSATPAKPRPPPFKPSQTLPGAAITPVPTIDDILNKHADEMCKLAPHIDRDHHLDHAKFKICEAQSGLCPQPGETLQQAELRASRQALQDIVDAAEAKDMKAEAEANGEVGVSHGLLCAGFGFEDPLRAVEGASQGAQVRRGARGLARRADALDEALLTADLSNHCRELMHRDLRVLQGGIADLEAGIEEHELSERRARLEELRSHLAHVESEASRLAGVRVPSDAELERQAAVATRPKVSIAPEAIADDRKVSQTPTLVAASLCVTDDSADERWAGSEPPPLAGSPDESAEESADVSESPPVSPLRAGSSPASPPPSSDDR